MLLGEPIDAHEALRLGLVNRVVAARRADGRRDGLGAAPGQPAARVRHALAKAALDGGIDAALDAALALEIEHAVITDELAAQGDEAVAASRARDRE